MRDSHHPGNHDYRSALGIVQRFEVTHGIESGTHSEQFAAAFAVMSERDKFSVHHIEKGQSGNIEAVRWLTHYNGEEERRYVDVSAALALTVEQHSAQWSQLGSAHYASHAQNSDRTPEQAQAISPLSASDREMFEKLLDRIPGYISDDALAAALHGAKKVDINSAEKVADVRLAGDKMYVVGTTPGFRAVVDLSQRIPPAKESVHQTQVLNQAQALAQQQEEQQRQARAADSNCRAV